MNLEEISIEKYHINIKKCRDIYELYMFGEYGFDYYEYCRIRKIPYGSFEKLMDYASVISRLKSLENEMNTYIFKYSEGNEAERQLELDSYKVAEIYYFEYIEYCKKHIINPINVSSYNIYVEETQNEFL